MASISHYSQLRGLSDLSISPLHNAADLQSMAAGEVNLLLDQWTLLQTLPGCLPCTLHWTTPLLDWTDAAASLYSAVNALGDPSVNLLAIVSTTTAILTLLSILGTRIYKTWCLGLLEISFILNLAILSAASYHIRLTGGNQNAATFTSVGIAWNCDWNCDQPLCLANQRHQAVEEDVPETRLHESPHD